MTVDSEDPIPYLEARSHALSVFNLYRLRYQALGLIFCTNTKSFGWKSRLRPIPLIL
jgi:hypothetical protein